MVSDDFSTVNDVGAYRVNLFKSSTLTLHDEEVDDEPTKDIATGKDIAIAKVDSASNEWCEEGEKKIPKPVGGSRKCHALGPVSRRVEFAADGPDHRPPGGREAKDEERRHDDHCGSCRFSPIRLVTIQGKVPDTCKDQEHDEHPRAANDQRLSATVVLDDIKAIKGRAEVDAVQNHLSDERVVDARALEDDSAVVEEVIGT